MSSKRTDHQQAQDDLPSKSSTTNHRTIINNVLDTVRKQEDIMEHLLRDLEFFRKQVKTSLEYDVGAGDYREEASDGTEYDARFESDVGDGTIKEETVVYYMGYKVAMDNFQMGFEKTKEQIEKIWKDVDVGKGFLAIPDWAADGLEKGRKAAAQE
jgi:hypothetical protein